MPFLYPLLGLSPFRPKPGRAAGKASPEEHGTKGETPKRDPWGLYRGFMRLYDEHGAHGKNLRFTVWGLPFFVSA